MHFDLSAWRFFLLPTLGRIRAITPLPSKKEWKSYDIFLSHAT